MIAPGGKVLVLEDEMLIAMLIEDMLMDLGFAVVGPVASVEKAMSMAREENLQWAILDVNVSNALSFPVADILRERRIPFIFATGYGSHGLDHRFKDAVVLQKPFMQAEFERAISQMLHNDRQ